MIAVIDKCQYITLLGFDKRIFLVCMRQFFLTSDTIDILMLSLSIFLRDKIFIDLLIWSSNISFLAKN